MTTRAKEVILSLMKRIDELKNKDNVSKKHDDDLKFKLNFFRSLLAFSWVVIIVLLIIILMK